VTPHKTELLVLEGSKGGGDKRARHVFLVEQAGSDFTFHIRDEGQHERLCRILEEKGEGERPPAMGVTSGPPSELKREWHYSCLIEVLSLQLDKDDFKREEKAVVFLKRLINRKGSGDHYDRLRKVLSRETRARLKKEDATDGELLDMAVGDLNGLSVADQEWGLSEKTPTKEERDLLAQLEDDKVAHDRLKNHFGFCSRFKDSIKPLGERIRSGRVLAALSCKGRVWSLTFRRQETGYGYAPSRRLDRTLNSIEEVCSTLYEEIFHAVGRCEDAHDRGEDSECGDGTKGAGGDKSGKNDPPYRELIDKHRNKKLPEMGGLIVVAGSTNSAKSLITRGLIHLYLGNVLKGGGGRRPHLVTFEDPIEKYFADPLAPAGPKDSPEARVDYTPRQQRDDTSGLRDALRDALRQTPKVFFVGETRRNRDWRALIDFAGTGHLVVTTAHAGSLIEAMHKILFATQAKTPADRNEVASRILAVVQLKRAEVTLKGAKKKPGKSLSVLVPAVWRRVPRGVDSLTAEGLASILPHSHSPEGRPCSSLGRKYFAGRLLQLAGERLAGERFGDEKFADDLKAKATDWDLQGA